MRKALTDKLLDEYNAKRGLSYPDVGYTYYADINSHYGLRSVYTIINVGGGVVYSSFNALSSVKTCANIRAALADL